MIPACSYGTLARSKFTSSKRRMERSRPNKKISSSISTKDKRKWNVDGSDGSNFQTRTSSLPRNINKINNADEHLQKKSCRQLYDPHKKYGIDIPSYDDILKDQKYCQDYKKAVQSLTQLTTTTSDGDDNFRQSNIASRTTFPLSPATNKINNLDKHIERKSCKKIYDPSKKYGMDIPSYDDILKDKKNCQEYKKSLQSLTHLITSTSEGDDHFRPKQSDIISQTSSTSTLALSPITNKVNNTDIEKKSCKKLYDPSTKYSIDVPSYEDILRDTKNCQDYKESVQSLVNLVAPKSNSGDNFDTKGRKDKENFKASGIRSKSKANFTRNKTHNTTTDHIKQKENGKVENSIGKCNESIQKYGVCIPSYEDILRDKKNCENYSNFLKNLTKLITSVSEIKTNVLEHQSPKVEVPNCKHMSKEAILSALERNFGYLDDIHKEKVYCERHERYKKLISRNGLTYSTSILAFTNEQKQLLVMELSKYYRDSDYYFKVLFPELCLKIFMDEYSMTRDEARKCMDHY